MLRDALAAYAHYAAILAVTVTLASEAVLYRRVLSQSLIATLGKLDIAYLFAAIALLVTGGLRLWVSPKGVAFYTHNPLFWTKIALFATIGILSIWPTRHFLALRPRPPATNDPKEIEPIVFTRVRALLYTEVAILFTIPLFASLMSRGFGYIP